MGKVSVKLCYLYYMLKSLLKNGPGLKLSFNFFDAPNKIILIGLKIPIN